MTTAWTAGMVASITEQDVSYAPLITDFDTRKILPDLDLWDMWPVRDREGRIATLGSAEGWMALSASAVGAPGGRHDVARIRLVSRREDRWLDLGNLFPDGESPGSREWAGSAILESDDASMTVYYTAAGRRGEPSPTFVQRIISARADVSTGRWDGLDWEPHRVALEAAHPYQSTLGQEDGEPGYIKAFRDPFFFSDPATGEDHLLFTGSLLGSSTEFDGVVGISSGDRRGRFRPGPPLVTADGVNNELERPHLVMLDGLYYLFFSTQARTFHPDTPGPTGLYGFVAPSLDGEWGPLNGSGLVLANPIEEPFQAYSWLVLGDLTVTSFIDSHTLGGAHPDEIEAMGLARAHFGGTPAPTLSLRLDGDRAELR
ncbi:MAG: glycoside hydrolase family 68 protein [Acidimicrobiia bacterium]